MPYVHWFASNGQCPCGARKGTRAAGYACGGPVINWRAEMDDSDDSLPAGEPAFRKTYVQALRNCLILAKRQLRKAEADCVRLSIDESDRKALRDKAEAWGHIVRFCEEAGITDAGSVLR